jgi:methionyl-tRNA formyltransferase
MTTKRPNLVFMGTPNIAADVLSRLLDLNIDISAVITRPDKPRGRGKQAAESPVKLLAKEKNIPTYQPRTKNELTDTLRKLKPDLGIIAAYGMIIPKDALDIPAHGIINFHPSLLPLLRGPAPISMAIMCGHKETGVTIMTVTEGMDEGDILAQEKYPLTGKETTPELENKLAAMGAKMLVSLIPEYIAGSITSFPQDHKKATYTHMVKKHDAEIIWTEYWAKGIEQASRAFVPWPGLFTYWNGKKLDLYDIEIVESTLRPGEVGTLKGRVIIGTAKGSVSPGHLKLEGKNLVDATDFIRGYPDFIGSVLGR